MPACPRRLRCSIWCGDCRGTHGQSLWEYFGERPAAGARFSDAMRQLTAMDLRATVRAYPWPRRGVICDVAGGIGHLLAAILDRRPRVRGVLVDAPEVIEEADELDARADVYTMKWILHDWSDDPCREILARLRAGMPAGSKLATIDMDRIRADRTRSHR